MNEPSNKMKTPNQRGATVLRALASAFIFYFVFTSHWSLVTSHLPGHLSLITCHFSSEVAYAQVPQLITYQGRLSEASGAPFSGTHTIVFRLYDAEQGGNELWEETHTITVATEDNGIFSVVLGSLVSLSELNFNQPLWLTMAVDGDSEMTPRQRVTSAGYAINADTLDGMDSNQFVRSDAASTLTGELTLSRSGRALVVKPSADPAASTTLVEVQNAAGTSTFSVDLEGDVAVAGNLTVTGTITGASLSGGTVTSVDSGAGLTGGPVTTSGTLAVGAGNGIQINADDVAVKLASGPGLAVDANGLSLLRSCSNGQLLKWNTMAGTWECAADADTTGDGTVTSVDSGAGLIGGPITSSGTLAVGAGDGITVNANDIAVELASGPGLAVDGSGVSLLRSCSDGQLLKWTASASSWGCADDADTDTNSGGTVTAITAGTGLSGGTITTSGTISLSTPVSVANGGTGLSGVTTGDLLYASAANTLSTLPKSADGLVLKLVSGVPAWSTDSTGGGGTGTVTLVDSGAGLSGGPITSSGTLTVGAGNGIAVSENDVAVDVLTTGSTATASMNSGLEASANGLRLLGGCSTGQLLKWNAASVVWECAVDNDTTGGGTVTSVDSGAGLTGGPVTTSGTLAVGAGDGIQVSTDDVAVKIALGGGLSADGNGLSLVRTCAANGQLLKWNTSVNAWECGTDIDTDTNSGGTVTAITAGTGLSGGTITTSGTISLSTPVSVANGGTGLSGVTTGDLLYASAANTLSTLPKSADGLVLKLVSGVPAWSTDSTGGGGDITGVTAGAGLSGGGMSGDVTLSLATPVAVANGGTGAGSFTAGGLLIGQGTSAMTTTGVLAKGSLIVGDGAVDPTALPVGGDNALLVADSAQSSGVRWATGCLPLGGASSTSHAANFEMGVGGGSDTNGRLDDAWPAPVDGTITSFRSRVRQAPGSGDSWTATLRKNNADTSLSCAISGASATSCSDTGTVTVAAGDQLGVAFTEGGSASGTTGSGWSACFVPD